MRLVVSFLSLTVAGLLSLPALGQTTWYVDASATPPGSGTLPDPYASIQYAIDAATTLDGDTLSVSAGTYFEAIDYSGKSIEIVGQGPKTTTIDATGKNSSVARLISGENSSSLLRGFTLTGGTGSLNVGYGSVSGGGILCVGTSPTLEELTIAQNSAGWGGGICLYSGANATVRDCEVFGNSAAPDGGGIYVRDCHSPTFIRVNVHDNQASTWGGGFYLTTDCDAYLENCVVTDNSAPTGGGLILQGDTDPVMVNCTVANNSNGFFLYHATVGPNDPQIVNSIVWANGGYNFSILSGSGSPSLTYSDVSGGWAGVGNINDDPLFTSDYHLQPDSPCIDAGDPMSSQDPDGTIADMGAYYLDQDPCQPPTVYCTPKVNSLGCTPSVGASGTCASISGTDNFVVRAANVLSQQNGIMIWSLTPAATPFGGGILCLSSPVIRTPGQNSGGNPPPFDCSGTYSFHFSQAYMQQYFLGQGDTVYAQWWNRDPGFSAPENIGLSGGLKFTIAP